MTLKEERIMSALLEKMNNYFKNPVKDPDTIQVAMMIAVYAHRKQMRVNEVPYINHPLGMVRHWIRLTMMEKYKINEEVMSDYHLPYRGVEEVIWLHDVVEDTEITHKDIEDIFKEYGYEEYFKTYIDEPLKLITHDKEIPYSDYIDLVMTHPTSALVKMIDICNNLDLFTLKDVGKKEVDRAISYIKYFKKINDKYNYVWAINGYCYEMKYWVDHDEEN